MADALKSGDLVLVIGVPPNHFPWVTKPYMVGTVSSQCSCVNLNGALAVRVEFPTTSRAGHCYPRNCLRKLDPPADLIDDYETRIKELQEIL